MIYEATHNMEPTFSEIKYIMNKIKENKMNDYRSRLITESQELKERLVKLTTFINGKQIHNLNQRDQKLLLKQQAAMREYDDILEGRLSRS